MRRRAGEGRAASREVRGTAHAAAGACRAPARCSALAAHRPPLAAPPVDRPPRPPTRQCISYVGRSNPELLPALHRWTAAVLPALASYLRQQEHYLETHLAAVLAPSELAWLRQRGIPPIAALQVGRMRLSGAALPLARLGARRPRALHRPSRAAQLPVPRRQPLRPRPRPRTRRCSAACWTRRVGCPTLSASSSRCSCLCWTEWWAAASASCASPCPTPTTGEPPPQCAGRPCGHLPRAGWADAAWPLHGRRGAGGAGRRPTRSFMHVPPAAPPAAHIPPQAHAALPAPVLHLPARHSL